MLQKLEKKLGKYAIPNLINYILMAYLIGYILLIFSYTSEINVLGFLTLEPYYIIHKFQIWRLFTWIVVPPSSSISILDIFFIAIMIYFYYSLGHALENTWGAFKFNLYIFGGLIFTILGSFLSYFVISAINGSAIIGIGSLISTSYINMTIFLAFALCYPDHIVYFYFILPLKMKWMAIVYAVIIGFEVIEYSAYAIYNPAYWAMDINIVASVLNFIIFYFSTKNLQASNRARQRAYQQSYRRGQMFGQGQNGQGFNPYGNPYGGQGQNPGQNSEPRKNMARSKNQPIARHKCAICGRTDITNPNLEFRFCSKCNGNYEYCNDHLFTHTHKQ